MLLEPVSTSPAPVTFQNMVRKELSLEVSAEEASPLCASVFHIKLIGWEVEVGEVVLKEVVFHG